MGSMICCTRKVLINRPHFQIKGHRLDESRSHEIAALLPPGKVTSR